MSGTFDKARKKRGPAGKRIQEIRRAQSRTISEQPNEGATRYSPPERRNGDFQMYLPESANNNILMASPKTPYWLPPESTTTSTLNDMDGVPLQHATTSGPIFSESSTQHPDPILTSPPSNDFIFPSLPVESPSSSWDPFGALLEQELPPVIANTDVWPSHINEETLLPWIDVYFKRLHPTIPILDRAELYRQMLGRRHRTESQYGAMLLSLCAFAMTQPIQIHERGSAPSRAMQARMLMEESVKMRVAADFGENPSIETILASFFLFACLFGSGQHMAARHRLREAVDLAQSLGIDQPHHYQSLDVDARERWLRTYLVLSVTERAYALQRRHAIDFRGRPGVSARFMGAFTTSDATTYITRLLYADQSDTTAMTGLMYMMEAFDAIDERVIDCWIGYCRYEDGVCETFDRRRALQTFAALRRARESSVEGNVSFAPTVSPMPVSKLLDSQRADIAVTQYWLMNRLWNLCLTHSLLRESSEHVELRFDFAHHLGVSLLGAINSLGLAAMEVHGVGFAEKVYDIATGMITALQTPANDLSTQSLLVQDPGTTLVLGQNEVRTIGAVLLGLQELLQTFRGGEHPYGEQLGIALSTVHLATG